MIFSRHGLRRHLFQQLLPAWDCSGHDDFVNIYKYNESVEVHISIQTIIVWDYLILSLVCNLGLKKAADKPTGGRLFTRKR
ncbi:hypothetical protein E2C01_014717 [Portunus trituberculatus]|uniref:Uncharacterized protein n=1 Tax=Portunus trituberculatus TaxID=210409 RepID=A0A5B7DKR4_PORTR|nr:hypothetical protein [Portunus trituberculatus]